VNAGWLLSLLRVPASLVIANGQERAEAFADKAAGAVGSDEIQSVGEVLDVELNTPIRVIPAEHQIADHIARNGIDVGGVAPGSPARASISVHRRSIYSTKVRVRIQPDSMPVSNLCKNDVKRSQ
jgi:hypothetical protein